jgi:hypothetical protein
MSVFCLVEFFIKEISKQDLQLIWRSAKLGDARSAREHLSEARRLTEHHGTPYGLLRTLSAEATILQSAALKREAAEYAKLLHELARS